MIENFKEIILNGPLWQVIMVVVFAGVIVSFGSCTIARIPLMLGSVNSSDGNKQRSFHLSLAFSAGLILSYTLIGIFFGVVVEMVSRMISISQFLYIALGIVLMVSGIFFARLIPPRLQWLNRHCASTIKKINTIPATFMFGMFFSFIELPACAGCGAGMMLLTSLVAIKGSIGYAALLFASFAIGQSLPIIAIGASTALLNRLAPMLEKFESAIGFVIGNILMVMGISLILIA